MLASPNAAMSLFFVVRLSECNWVNNDAHQALVGNSPFPNNSTTVGLFLNASENGPIVYLRLGGVPISVGTLNLKLGEQAVLAILYNDASFGIYRTETGAIVHHLVGATGAFAGTVPFGTEAIIAATYDDTTGAFSIENVNGSGGTSALGTSSRTTGVDLTSNTPLTLFCSPNWGNFYCDATFAEVRVYDALRSDRRHVRQHHQRADHQVAHAVSAWFS